MNAVYHLSIESPSFGIRPKYYITLPFIKAADNLPWAHWSLYFYDLPSGKIPDLSSVGLISLKERAEMCM